MSSVDRVDSRPPSPPPTRVTDRALQHESGVVDSIGGNARVRGQESDVAIAVVHKAPPTPSIKVAVSGGDHLTITLTTGDATGKISNTYEPLRVSRPLNRINLNDPLIGKY